MKKQVKWVLTALLVYAGLSLDLASHGESTGLHQITLNLIGSFRGMELSRTLILPGVYLLLRQADRAGTAVRPWAIRVPAVFFALNMALGYAFSREGSWSMLGGLGDGQLLKTALTVASWTVVFHCGLKIAYHYLDTLRITRPETEARGKLESPKGLHPLRRYGRMFREHSFLTPFLTLCVLYIPRMLISFPGMFMGDTWSVIVQAYGELQDSGVEYLTADTVMRPGIFINQHHSVLYTLCLHAFLLLGDSVFHSLNAGLFLFTLGQAALMLSACAWVISSLARTRAASGVLAFLTLYAFFQPQQHNLLMLVTKDGCYAACFLFLMGGIFRIRTEGAERKSLIACGLAAVGMILLRNEGRYVLLIAGLLIAWADRKNRKRVLCLTLASVILSAGIYRGLYPALGFTPGSTREALSVPFQQTARIVRDHPEGITEDERAAIDRVLAYDSLAESYDMNESDPVKSLYRNGASGADRAAFFRAWAALVIRYPDSAAQATYGNYYQFLYPAEEKMNYYSYGWSDRACSLANAKIAPLGKSFSLPEWNLRGRLISDSIVEAGLFQVPVLGAMMTAGLYTWGLIVLLCWALGRRGKGKGVLLALCVVPILTLGVQFVGPSNGNYGRYMLPITSFLPAMACMLMILRERSEAGEERKG